MKSYKPAQNNFIARAIITALLGWFVFGNVVLAKQNNNAPPATISGATACFYPTWLHNGQLGQGANADSLQCAAEIRSAVLLLFGTLDPYTRSRAGSD